MALNYCKKCGRLLQNSWGENDLICDCCKTKTIPVPKEFLDKELGVFFKDKNTKQQFINEYIKKSPEFDQYLFDHRDEILAKQSAEFNAKLEHGKAILEGRDKGNKFGVECPYCHATNVKRITATSKAVHTAIFGIFSMGRNAKNYHCNNCNSDF